MTESWEEAADSGVSKTLVLTELLLRTWRIDRFLVFSFYCLFKFPKLSTASHLVKAATTGQQCA